MKKKVLPPFHHHDTSAEEALIAVCKNHFTSLKLKGQVIIPFAFVSDYNGNIRQLFPSALSTPSKLTFIEQFWEFGLRSIQAKEAICFAVCYDAHVFDEEEVDQDALVLMLKKEDGKQQQINIPYITAEDSIVFGEEWLDDLGNLM